MNKEQRKSANDSQVITFFGSYDFFWRLTKLLSIKNTLEQRESFKIQLNSHYGEAIDNYDHYVYSTTTNGLIFSAISELTMYIEDLFSLIKYIREEEYFVQKLVQYDASKVTQLAYKIHQKPHSELLKAFMIPERSYLQSLIKITESSEEEKLNQLNLYDECMDLMLTYIKDIASAYKKFHFYHNQYKHGLSVALKMFGNNLAKEVIEEMKKKFSGYPMVFDNDSVDNKFKKGRLDGNPLVIPNLSPEIQPHITKLQNENNLLTFHSFEEIDINQLIEIADKVSALIYSIMKNRIDFIQPANPKANTVYFPKKGESFKNVNFIMVPEKEVLKLSHFAVTI